MDRRESLRRVVEELARAEEGEAGGKLEACYSNGLMPVPEDRVIWGMGCFNPVYAPPNPPFYWRWAICRHVSQIHNLSW